MAKPSWWARWAGKLTAINADKSSPKCRWAAHRMALAWVLGVAWRLATPATKPAAKAAAEGAPPPAPATAAAPVRLGFVALATRKLRFRWRWFLAGPTDRAHLERRPVWPKPARAAQWALPQHRQWQWQWQWQCQGLVALGRRQRSLRHGEDSFNGVCQYHRLNQSGKPLILPIFTNKTAP